MKTILFLSAASLLLLAYIPAHGEDFPVVLRLRDEYQKARAAALAQLNGGFAAEADGVMKQYLQAGDLADANRAADFSKHLKDDDEKNDLDGITTPSSPTDRLGNLEARYVRSREDTVRKLNQTFTASGQALQNQLMRTNDLGGANGVAAFLEQIKPIPSLVTASDASKNGHNLLARENEKKWKITKGVWKIDNNVLAGAGESDTVFHETFYPPFTLQFKIDVIEGSRARIRFGPFTFANEGYDTTFGLYPKPEGALFHYQRNTEYKVSIVVSHKSVDLLIDDKLITSRPGVKEKIDKIDFSAGDAFSKGRVEFRDVTILK